MNRRNLDLQYALVLSVISFALKDYLGFFDGLGDAVELFGDLQSLGLISFHYIDAREGSLLQLVQQILNGQLHNVTPLLGE